MGINSPANRLMSVFKTTYPISKVFENQSAAGVTDPIGCADFKSIEFSIVTDASADFDIRCVGSIQNNPPDPSQAVGVDNDYQYVVYTDETASASYNNASPFNPSGAVSKVFRFNTEGMRWAFIEIFNYVDGSVIVCNVNLSDNE